MVKYKCPRCDYNTTHRNSMRYHLNRKNICEPILDDISIEDIKKYYKIDNHSIITPNHSICPSIITPNHSIQYPVINTNKLCKYCLKTFSRKDNLNKHLKICKEKKNSNILALKQDEEIINIKKELEELKQSNNITNSTNTNSNNTNTNTNNTNNNSNNTNNINNNNNNNTQNILISNYGEENLKYLRPKDYKGYLSNIAEGIPKLIRNIHFNKDHPENHNIKYTDTNSPYFEIYKDDKWNSIDKNTEIRNMIYNNYCLLLENYYKLLRKQHVFTQSEIYHIDNFIKNYKNQDTSLVNDLIDITQLVLHNNSKN